MFTFPPSMWVANILYEHGHRLIASTVGFLTIVMAVWLWVADPRRWLRWFGVATLGSVVAQGLLGGLTVLFFLPAAISTAHAGLAEIFFCMTVAIAIFTSPGWIAGYGTAGDGVATPLRTLATTATVLIYAQILVGATMRHTGAGLAIPDFPLMFGHVIPDHWSSAIAIHFTHRVGALLVTMSLLALFVQIRSQYRDHVELVRPATLIMALVAVQVSLGALTVLSRRDPWINSFHVVCGALVLTTSLIITLRSWRGNFAYAAVRLKPDTTEQRAGRLQGHATEARTAALGSTAIDIGGSAIGDIGGSAVGDIGGSAVGDIGGSAVGDIGSVRLQPDRRGHA
jgi:cytochrome c oxidase assembly protein subunit 15